MSVSLPEPAFLPESFKKKDVVEILSYKKAYNACEYDHAVAARDLNLYLNDLNIPSKATWLKHKFSDFYRSS